MSWTRLKDGDTETPAFEQYSEFVLGAARLGVNLTNNAVVGSIDLLQGTYSRICLGAGGADGLGSEDKCLVGISFDDSSFGWGGKSSEISFEGLPILDEIVCQTRAVACSDAPHLYKLDVGYLRLRAGEQEIEVGARIVDGETTVNGLRIVATPERTLAGKFMIVGVGTSMFGVCCLQVADFSAARSDAELEDAVAMATNGRSTLSTHSCASEDFGERRSTSSLPERLVAIDGMVAFERVETAQNMLRSMAHWYAFYPCLDGGKVTSDSAWCGLAPKFSALLETSIRSGDHLGMRTLLRMSRAMKAGVPGELKAYEVVGEYCKPEAWLGDTFPWPKAPLEGLRLLVSPLIGALVTANQLVQKKPSLNCYTLFYVQPSLYNLVVVTITCLLQLSMIALLATDCVETVQSWVAGDSTPFVLPEAIPITGAIAFYFALLMDRQRATSRDFYGIFRSATNDNSLRWERRYLKALPFGLLVRWLGVLVNQVMGWVLVVITVILLSASDARFDLVMNSLAAAFVIELDDLVIDIDDDGTKDVFLESINHQLHNGWREAKKRYETASAALST